MARKQPVSFMLHGALPKNYFLHKNFGDNALTAIYTRRT